MSFESVRRCGMSLLVLVAASCSTGSDQPSTTAASTVAPTTTGDVFTTDTEPATTTTTTTVPQAAFADGPLAEVCDSLIVIQASDLPGVGVGPLYALLGAQPVVEPSRQALSGLITRPDGTVEDVMLEIRSGGPAIGFRSPVAVMGDDPSVALAQVSTAVAVRDRDILATQAVMSLTDRSRDAVIFDPVNSPDVEDFGGLREAGVEVRHVTGAPVIAFLAASGALAPEQLTGGSDGGPASFVAANGAIAQQGDLTVEPALLPSLPQLARPVVALPASDAGWLSLDDMLIIDAESERISSECLGRLVRVIQQSIVAYVEDPAATNAIMSDARSLSNPLNRLSTELFGTGTQLAIDAGVFDRESPLAPGAIDTNRLTPFLPELSDVLGVDAVPVTELVDQQYIDPTIPR